MGLVRSAYYDASPATLPDDGILARLGTIYDEFEGDRADVPTRLKKIAQNTVGRVVRSVATCGMPGLHAAGGAAEQSPRSQRWSR